MTSRTRSTLGTNNTSQYADNTTGAITPAILRAQQQDQIDSTLTLADNTGQYPGSSTNDSASAGNLGEIISSTILVGAPVSLATSVASNVTSIALTGGDWDVSANFSFTGGGSTSTTISYFWGSLSSVSATIINSVPGQFMSVAGLGQNLFNLSGGVVTYPLGPARFSIGSAGATIYMATQVGFGVSAANAFGIIRGRRVR